MPEPAGRTSDPSSGNAKGGVVLFRRVERLARTLLRGQYDGAETLWTFQTDLLKLQRDIQGAITQEKARPRSQRDLQSLHDLRACRWHARRLGDALAWLLLGMDRRVIASLARNDLVPIGDEDHGSRGLEAISTYLADEGWGFPLLHDVTDCLRIGDVTFVGGSKGSDRVPRTAEVKTRLISADVAGDDHRFQYEVSLLATAAPPVEVGEVSPHPSFRLGSRAKRQLQRMATARAHATAPEGELVEIDGEPPLLSVQMDSVASSHWTMIRRVIRESRKTGHSSASVEDTFLYVALYNDDGVGIDDIETAQLPAEVMNSGILPSSQPDRDGVIFNTVPPVLDRGPHVFLPYFLYPIPKRAIFEILQQKLMLFVLVNPGRVLEALEHEGFEAWTQPDPKGRCYGTVVARTEIPGPEGDRYLVELRNLEFHMREVIYEFRSVEYLIEIAREMRDRAANTLPSPASSFVGGRMDDASWRP